MPEHLTISTSDIIHRLKVSCQIPEVIEAIASQVIITEAAQKAGIELTEAELQSEGDKFRVEKNIATAKETWAWLDKHHMSVKEFEELIYNNLIAKKLAHHMFAAKVEKFFYENRIDYEAAVTYEVTFENRDLALELFYALEEGEITFPEIARLYIQDPQLRRAGGYQGVRYRKDFRPEIAAAVFAATSCQMLKPITTPKGVYLIWVEEIIQPELNEELREKIICELFDTSLKKEVQFLKITTQLDADATQVQNELLNHA
ncbi:MAG: peptidylprolyl isomerase [Nostocaceae cyanobacterium]|nr:peptidylprolyl isomerase [Nostocaceae cyanobacterium]